MIAPSITSPRTALELVEGQFFSYQLRIDQGSLPIEWTIVGMPMKGMDLDLKSGIFSWENPIASSTLVHIQVQATNELSRSDPVELTLHISPSYFVRVSTATVSYSRPSPAVYFDCFTVDMSSKGPIGGMPAVLWILEQGISEVHRRKVTVKTNSFGFFRCTYQPYSTDAGVFFYGGEHPLYSNLTVQGKIMIAGVDIIPNYYFFRGFPSESQSITDAFNLHFRGGSFTGINILFDQSSDLNIVPYLNSSTASSTSGSVTMSLNISSSTEFKGPVYFHLSTNEGLRFASSYVYMDVRYRAPKLVLSGSMIDVNAESGATKFYDVTLQNAGSLASNSIEIVFAIDGIIHPVSEYLPALAVDESTSVSLKVLVPDESDIGTVFTGAISFISKNAEPAVLEYRVTSISSLFANLTIVTQNEATFFSDGQPNLDNVDVIVRSLTGGTIVYTGSSGMNGTIALIGIVEDFYEIIARKPRHKTFTRKIFLKSPGQTVKAFLSFESVSYTFYVIPIEVADKYKIIVESTFTTGKCKHRFISLKHPARLNTTLLLCLL